MSRTKTAKNTKRLTLRRKSRFGPDGKAVHVSNTKIRTIIRKHRQGV